MRGVKTILVVLATSGLAYGQPPPEPKPPPAAPTSPVDAEVEPSVEPVLTADTVRDDPRPGQEHGRLDPVDTGDSTPRWIGRQVLRIPQLPFLLLWQPARGFFYLQDRYHLIEAIEGALETDDGRIAGYPTALVETGFGLNVGARIRFKNVFDQGERISARVGFGGQDKQVVAVDATTSGRLSLGLKLRYEVSDTDRFFGYGNGDFETPMMPIDPLTSDAAVQTDLGTTMLKGVLGGKYRLTPNLAITVNAAVVNKSFDVATPRGDRLAIDEAFDIERIPGFVRGTRFLYNELEVAYDTRRTASRWDPAGLRTSGGLVLGFVGRQDGLRDDEPSFYRVGLDLQRYVRITNGPRVLEVRAYGELVTGERDEVPFTELPRLGGSSLLRGFATDRFRDRLALVTQVSYTWAASSWFAPSLFVDAGRVYSGLDAVSLDGIRTGFGFAMDVYRPAGLLVRFQIAASVDGDMFTFLMLNPVFDARGRVERR